MLLLSLIPAVPDLPGAGWDKRNHFLGFVALTLLGVRAYAGRPGHLLAGLLLLGGLIEVLQSLTPYRLAEWMDWFADGVGIVVGYGLCWVWRRMRNVRRGASG